MCQPTMQLSLLFFNLKQLLSRSFCKTSQLFFWFTSGLDPLRILPKLPVTTELFFYRNFFFRTNRLENLLDVTLEKMSDIDKKLQSLDQIRNRLQRTGGVPQYERHLSRTPDKKSFDFRMLSSNPDINANVVWNFIISLVDFIEGFIIFLLMSSKND